MKYSITSRQTKQYLELADEIMVKDQDYRQVIDLFTIYPDKIIILEVSNENIDNEDFLEILKEYNEISKNFCCKIYNLHKSNWFKKHNIKFYYGFPINSYYDLQGLIDLGVEYIAITAPLTFDIQNLSYYNMKFRMVPNVAYDAYIPRANGICGQWVRPEDVKYYDKGIYIFDFEDADLQKERTLYDVYTKEIWPGNLKLLISNLDINVDNRAIPEEFGGFRANCGQRCMSNGSCHFCETIFKFERMLRVKAKEIDEIIQEHVSNLSEEVI